MIETKIQFNKATFAPKLQKLARGLDDLRPVWPHVADELDRIVQQIFDSEGAATLSGAWQELSDKYAARKSPDNGILRRTDAMMNSLTHKYAHNAIFLNRKHGFTRGSRDRKVKFHQDGTKNMPARRIYDFREYHLRRMRNVLREKLRALTVSVGIQVD